MIVSNEKNPPMHKSLSWNGLQSKTFYESPQESKNPGIYVLFSAGSDFVPQGTFSNVLRLFFIVTTGGKDAIGNQWLEARDPATISTMYRTGPQQEIIWPKIIQTK